MHGPLTDQAAVARLRQALQSDTAAEPFEIVLYTSSGQCYWHVSQKQNVCQFCCMDFKFLICVKEIYTHLIS